MAKAEKGRVMSYSHIRNKIVICRKDHVCEWCGQKLHKKEEAMNRVYVFEGSFNNCYQHLECYEAMNKSIFNYPGEDSFDFGDQQRGIAIDGYGDPLEETT